MSVYVPPTTQDLNPLVDYAIKNMWGNPELDSQYQVKLARLSPRIGFTNDFPYLGKTRFLPTVKDLYHVFTLGGLDSGFWNLGSRGKDWYPVDKWVLASVYSSNRGVSLDFYNSSGKLFPRTFVWVMKCFDGVTLVAFPDNRNYPIPMNKNMFMRCYSTDININSIPPEEKAKWTFGYTACVYNEPSDFDKVKNSHTLFTSYKMGLVQTFLNGVVTPIENITPEIGDMIEVMYDPSVGMVVRHNYKYLPDFYSPLDQKRKVILLLGLLEEKKVYRYYDDCDFYIFNKITKQGMYYHRNNENAIRQLTHQDYSLCAEYAENVISNLLALDKTATSRPDDFEVVVVYRNTKWRFELGQTSSRIKDLYALEDVDAIFMAMTGVNSNIPEWTARELERSSTNLVLNSRLQGLTVSSVREGLGYHGCSMAISENLHYMPHIDPTNPQFKSIAKTPTFSSGLGYRIPPTYMDSSTVYEYGEDGLFIRKKSIKGQEWYMPGVGCFYCEFMLGEATTWLDYVISKKDVRLKPNYGFRVYKAKWAIDPDWSPDEIQNGEYDEIPIAKVGDFAAREKGEFKTFGLDGSTPPDLGAQEPPGKPFGEWIDITDTGEYRIENGYLVWEFDTINNVGLVVFDTKHLYNSFELSHIDNSLEFGITHKWECGGLLLDIPPAQLDVWLNNHPLTEGVDYVVDFPRVYIISKMWQKEGTQLIAYRGVGLSPTGLVKTSELGFVADGVIGYNGQYNLRKDRPTKTVVNGRLFLTSMVDAAENINHGNNMLPYNGRPYEVKHYYTPNKFVEQWDNYWGRDKSMELDSRICAYLTEHVKYKPVEPVDNQFMAIDKYTLFSPFLNQIINEIVLGFIKIPDLEEGMATYPDYVIDELTRDYQWMLKYDPVILDLPLTYFAILPHNNWENPALTANQLTVVKRVNDLFLKGKVFIEGYVEVKHV